VIECVPLVKLVSLGEQLPHRPRLDRKLNERYAFDHSTYSGISNYLGSAGTLSGGQFVTSQPVLQLVLDESGPDANQAAAFDSLLFRKRSLPCAEYRHLA